MSWSTRVVWREGMFLRTQHFQQQDRWTESLVRGVTRALRPHPWGLIDYTVDRDLLGTGRFALASVESARGVPAQQVYCPDFRFHFVTGI